MPQVVLGLDLGPNSIGWALIRDDAEDPANCGLIDAGVRVFPEGVDAFDTSKEKSRNESRRVARGMRRQVQRRNRRRRQLTAALIEAGLWPADVKSQEEFSKLDPYPLRKEAVERPLEPFEIGRVLLHLNQRRGFLSNRKKDRGDKEVQGMLAEINDNERKRVEGNHPTIGAFLASKAAAINHCERAPDDHVRNRHLAREQIEAEFEAIWKFQSPHQPDLLTEALRAGQFGTSIKSRKSIPRDDPRRAGLTDLAAFGIHGLMFFQRRTFWPKSVVGLCEFEPKQKRCPKADRRAERFRVLQEVNNLRYSDTATTEESRLSERQRKQLISFLATKEKPTFNEIRNKLGFLESVKFNLERGERSSLKGFAIDVKMARAIGKHWHDRPEEEKDTIVRLLIDTERDEDVVESQLVEKYGMTTDEAAAAVGVDLPPKYMNLSLKAIDKLVPPLERGLVYQSISDPEESAIHAAGYYRRDELRRRLFDTLPDFTRMNPADAKLGDIPNPVVKRALVELHKVVNAIVRTYGKPDAIHIEMTRSVQVGAERRREMSKRMRDREAERETAADAVAAIGVAVRRDSIQRFLMWEEQSHECVYCGEPISQQQLFGGEVDVDHILPYSRCLDDSQMNKVVCHRMCNHDKGQRSPYEWLAATAPEHYARVCQQAGSLLKKGRFPYPKYRRFLQKELELDKFIARQLTDTGYITRATVEYVRLLFDKDHAVLGLKGQLTAELRWHWGLDTILEELPDSPAWHEKNDLRPGEKNRADHRHHAIDAIVVALTNRSRLHKLSDIVRRGGARKHGEILAEPWKEFRESIVEHVKAINVSHRVERKVRGALHEDTLYGPTPSPNEWVSRKPVIDLSAAEVDRIRDPGIKKIVVDRLREHGLQFGRGKKPDAKKMKAALANLAMPSGVPIKKVRLVKLEQTIQPLRDNGEYQAQVKPGSTHHLCIFEFTDKKRTKREAIYISMLEAAKRLKRGEALIQRTHPRRPDARFVMSLASREMVMATVKGRQAHLVFRTAPSTRQELRCMEHTDARRSYNEITVSASNLEIQKVTVDPLGRIRWAND